MDRYRRIYIYTCSCIFHSYSRWSSIEFLFSRAWNQQPEEFLRHAVWGEDQEEWSPDQVQDQAIGRVISMESGRSESALKSWLVQQHCFSMPLSVSYVLVIFFSVGSDWWSRTAGKAMSAPRCHDGVLTDPILIHHNFLHFVLVYISNYIWQHMTFYIIDEWIHIDTRYSGYFRLATPGSRKLLGSFQVQPIPLHFDHDRQDQGMDGISQII